MRGIQGQYSLQGRADAAARACRACARRKDIKFIDGPQTFSRHYVEPKDGITQTFHLHLEEYAPGRQVAEARPRQRGGVLHPRRRRLRDPRRRPLRLEGGRRRHRAQQLRAPALQRRAPTKPARALVIKTKPMFMFMNMLFQKHGRAAAERARARRRRLQGARGRSRTSTIADGEGYAMAWERIERVAERARRNQKLYQALLEDAADGAGAQRASARRWCIRRTCRGRCRARACSSTC